MGLAAGGKQGTGLTILEEFVDSLGDLLVYLLNRASDLDTRSRKTRSAGDPGPYNVSGSLAHVLTSWTTLLTSWASNSFELLLTTVLSVLVTPASLRMASPYTLRM